MIIDFHSHYMPPEVAKNTAFFKEFWSDSDRQLKLMDQHHVDRAVLLYPTSDAHLNMGWWGNVCLHYNKGIADLVKAHPTRFIGAGIIPVDAPDLITDELKRIKDLGLKVISLASSYNGKYLDDPVFNDVYEFSRREKMPIHVHAQIINPIGEERVRDPLLSPVLEYVFDVTMCLGKMMMSGVFDRYPEVNFIFPHFGGVLPVVKDRFDTTYTMLRKRNIVKDLKRLPSEIFKTIYLDMSGSKSFGALQSALEVVGSNRILWGSDFPANTQLEESLSVINCNILSMEERFFIQGKNAAQLLS